MFLYSVTSTIARADEAVKADITVEWEAIEEARSYHVEISKLTQGTPEAPLVQRKTTKPKWQGQLPPGRYQLRVRSVDSRGVSGAWSDPAAFVAQYPPVKPLAPTEGATIAKPQAEVNNTAESGNAKVEFKWQSFVPNVSYELRVLDQEGAEVQALTIAESAAKVALEKATRYSWEVTAISKEGDRGKSLPQPLKFSVLGEKLETPKVEVEADDKAASLSWTDVANAQKYKVTIRYVSKGRKQPQKLMQHEDFQETELAIDPKWPPGRYEAAVVAKADLYPQSEPGKLKFTMPLGGVEKKKRKSRAVKLLKDTFASAYAGIRYGVSLVKDDPLLEKATIVSVLTEFRGGPLKGLRWYWDFVPEVKVKHQGKDLSFTWSRPSLGWSLGLEMKGLVKSIDVTPKFGVMDLDATVAIPSVNPNATVQTHRFREKNIENFGLEIGTELGARWFLLRFWGATDISGLLKVGNKKTTVSSIRGGIDTYWNVTKFRKTYRLAVLGFGTWERLVIKQTVVEEEAGDSGVALQGIEYMPIFVGSGLVLTW